MTSRAPNFIAAEILQATRAAVGDQEHVFAVLKRGGFQTLVGEVWTGPDGKPWRPGVPVRVADVVARRPTAVPPAPKASTAADMFRRRVAMLRHLESGPASTSAVGQALGLTQKQAAKTLSRMHADRLVEVDGKPCPGVPNVYAITDQGRRLVAGQARAA